MESNLIECVNNKCSRKYVMVMIHDNEVGKPKFCTSCGKRMRPITTNLHKVADTDNGQAWGGLFGGKCPVCNHYGQYCVCKTADKREPTKLTPTPVELKDTWTCTPDVKGCPLIKDKPQVHIPEAIWNEWIFLTKQLDTEWIAYFKGHLREEDGVWVITETYYPKQTASAATCSASDGEVQDGTIGSVHSHVGMRAFFSTTDEAHMNHTIEMVINRSGEYEAMLRIKLECGRYSRISANVRLIIPDEQMAKVTALKEQIVQPEVKQPQQPTVTTIVDDKSPQTKLLIDRSSDWTT